MEEVREAHEVKLRRDIRVDLVEFEEEEVDAKLRLCSNPVRRFHVGGTVEHRVGGKLKLAVVSSGTISTGSLTTLLCQGFYRGGLAYRGVCCY
jgi:hypothetical protein